MANSRETQMREESRVAGYECSHVDTEQSRDEQIFI